MNNNNNNNNNNVQWICQQTGALLAWTAVEQYCPRMVLLWLCCEILNFKIYLFVYFSYKLANASCPTKIFSVGDINNKLVNLNTIDQNDIESNHLFFR